MNFDLARKIADAVLYEGYVLYPYRASAIKNRFRWQFGIVAPRGWSESGGEPWEMQTEVLIEPREKMVLEAAVRFLQVSPRTGEDGSTWEEGVERTIDLEPVAVSALAGRERITPFTIEAEGPAVTGNIRVGAEQVDGFWKVRVRIENVTGIPEDADRSTALRHSLTGAHTLLGIAGGDFVSLMDPPPDAKAAAASCANLHTWPVLVGREGERNVMLSSPIILHDYPAVAPESPGDFFDSTEIDELLTLRVMTLTDEEKREACATDERARKIIERSDSIPPEIFERLHGAIRSMRPVAAPANPVEAFFNPQGETPELAAVQVGGRSVGRGARVRLAPNRRSDSMDLFLAGRTARVEAVHRDVEDRVYVAVTVEGDPAADLNGSYGRFYYFYPDEIELMEV